ncbi:MAG: hypothetical protein ACREPE_06440, partial [Lysobacter sp.]
MKLGTDRRVRPARGRVTATSRVADVAAGAFAARAELGGSPLLSSAAPVVDASLGSTFALSAGLLVS